MGNIASYFSEKIALEGHVFGQTSQGKSIECSNETPTRCAKMVPGNQLFDPRSPTFAIDRTPIVVSVFFSTLNIKNNLKTFLLHLIFSLKWKVKMRDQRTQDHHHLE